MIMIMMMIGIWIELKLNLDASMPPSHPIQNLPIVREN